MSGGKATTFDNDILKLILWGTGIANLADNAASSPLTQLYAALHTADPGVGGSQTTSEAAYPGYARKAINRDNTGFSISGNSASFAANENFPTCTGGTETEAFWSLGTAATGAGKILYRGPLSANIIVSNTVTPQLTTGTTITEN
jgi:hypothetical protein